jgi:hypothetical protein
MDSLCPSPGLALLQQLVVVLDNYSRRVMGVGVFKEQPSSQQIRVILGRAMTVAGATPGAIITDHDSRFTGKSFRRSCRRRRIEQRFGALGKFGSIAVIERFMRRILVPYGPQRMRDEVNLFADWYNQHRPHTALDGMTPDEIYFGSKPASRRARYEPRPRWPRGSPSAGAQTKVRGRTGARLQLGVSFIADRRHLPIITLKRVA